MQVEFKYAVGQTVFFHNPLEGGRITEAFVVEQRFTRQPFYLISFESRNSPILVSENEICEAGLFQDVFMEVVPELQRLTARISEVTLQKHFEINLTGAKVTIDFHGI